ncbi:hypothetical protein JCM16303_000572 [Sporobolomyces ruberrimus]
MSGLLSRYSSYTGGHAASHHIRPSPARRADEPPTDPFPPTPNSLKPSDVLINRCHQLKRFAKHLSLYFQELSQAHHAHSLSLQKLPQKIPTPIQEASIFLPSDPPPSTSSSSSATPADQVIAPLGGTGQEGWAQLLNEIKATNERISLAHQELAKQVTKDVVGPLNKLRETIKAHINAMEKDINRLCDLVQRERDLTAPLLARLESSLSSQPLRPQLSDDPLLIRAQLESQLSTQISKENDLLVAVKAWTEKTEVKEKELFADLAKCWRDWESTNSAMLLANQQLSMFLSATVDSVPPESEWNHFLKLNHSIPPETPTRTLKDVEWTGKGDERCGILLEGHLERQTSFLKSWKPAYFILTATGHLLLYQPPVASSSSSSPTNSRSRASTLTVPPPQHHSLSSSLTSSSASSLAEGSDSTSLSTLSPTAFHLLTTSTPLVTLYLPHCSLGPMPTPDHPDSSTENNEKTKKKEPKKKGGLDAAFTLIESEGKGTKHIMRAVPVVPDKAIEDGSEENGTVAREGGGSADEWETMGTWIKEISKFTLPAPPSPTLPSLPSSPSTVSLAAVPPSLPSRSLSSNGTNASSPPLPQLPSPPLASDATTITPTPASTSIFGGFFGGGGLRSSTATSRSATTASSTAASEPEDEEVDLGQNGSPPPLPPRDHDHSSFSINSRLSGQQDAVPITIIEDQSYVDSAGEDDEEEGRGDLGRSLSPPPAGGPPTLPSRSPKRVLPPNLPSRTNSGGGGRVANLAKAFDQEATRISTSPSMGSLTSPKVGGSEKEEEDGGDIGQSSEGGKPRLSLDRTPPSSSPKSFDLSLASPPLDLGESQAGFEDEELGDHETKGEEKNPFDLSLSHLELDQKHDGGEGDLGGVTGGGEPGDMSFDEEKLEREYGLDGENQGEEVAEGDVTSPPPMVLEEVEEAPAQEREANEEEKKEENHVEGHNKDKKSDDEEEDEKE